MASLPFYPLSNELQQARELTELMKLTGYNVTGVSPIVASNPTAPKKSSEELELEARERKVIEARELQAMRARVEALERQEAESEKWRAAAIKEAAIREETIAKQHADGEKRDAEYKAQREKEQAECQARKEKIAAINKEAAEREAVVTGVINAGRTGLVSELVNVMTAVEEMHRFADRTEGKKAYRIDFGCSELEIGEFDWEDLADKRVDAGAYGIHKKTDVSEFVASSESTLVADIRAAVARHASRLEYMVVAKLETDPVVPNTSSAAAPVVSN